MKYLLFMVRLLIEKNINTTADYSVIILKLVDFFN
jgi:hypothetical protein